MDLLSWGGVDENLYNDLYEDETLLNNDDSFFESPVRIAAYSCTYSSNYRDTLSTCYASNNGCTTYNSGYICNSNVLLTGTGYTINASGTEISYLSSSTTSADNFEGYVLYTATGYSGGGSSARKSTISDFVSKISGSAISGHYSVGECVVYDSYYAICALKS